ncbi:hypothetical protein BC834DRAFT_878143 [Gloeopeniophorella convolvens]|nr:hypothetical protein BC834DRAFT_878143 [Gloeopeniophorella convolvens]
MMWRKGFGVSTLFCSTLLTAYISAPIPHTLRRYVLHPTIGDTLQSSPPLCCDTRLAVPGALSSRSCRAPCKALAALARRAADVPALPGYCRARCRQHRAVRPRKTSAVHRKPRASRCAARHAASMHHGVPSSAALHEAHRQRPRAAGSPVNRRLRALRPAGCRRRLTCGTRHTAPRWPVRVRNSWHLWPHQGDATAVTANCAHARALRTAHAVVARRSVVRLPTAVGIVIPPER